MHLQYVLITIQICVTITCSIQPTGVFTIVMKVLHNNFNMRICDLPDVNFLACSPWALSIHIRQITHAHVTTITNKIIFIATLCWKKCSVIPE